MSNLANSHDALGRREEAVKLYRDVYSGRLKLDGKDHRETCRAANNYATTLIDLNRLKEAKALLRKMVRVARRVLGETDRLTLKMRMNYALTLCEDDGATLDDQREAVTTLEDTERTARRVLGSAHPITRGIGDELRDTRAALRARETPPGNA